MKQEIAVNGRPGGRSDHYHNWLFPLLLAATLFQNYHDLAAILSGANLALYTYDGPILYKITKDILYVAILMAVLVHGSRTRTFPFTDYAIAVFSIVLALWLISVFANGIVIATLGLRWVLPLLLFFLLRDWTRSLDTSKAARWLLVGMIACLAAQIYQIFNMPPVFGEVLPGIPARTPGIFVAPNSTAFFACSSTACVLVFTPSRRRLHWLCASLALVMSLLAQSGTGIITAAVLVIGLATKRRPAVFWLFAVAAVLLMFSNLDNLTQRDDYVARSGGGRVEVLTNIASKSFLSLTSFGIFTNAANIRSENPENEVAPDSLAASWIGNFGLTSVFVLAVLGLFLRFGMRNVDWWRAMPCVVVFALFSMTTIVFEAFPMNLYLALGIWCARKS